MMDMLRAGMLPRLGWVLPLTAALALFGCTTTSDDENKTTDEDDAEQAMVLAASGEHVSMQGTWVHCYVAVQDENEEPITPTDAKEIEAYDGLVTTWSVNYYANDPADGSCSGDETVGEGTELSVVVGDDTELAGWSDGDSGNGYPDPAPPTSDGTTEWADPLIATMITVTPEGGEAHSSPTIIDDTGDTWLRYRPPFTGNCDGPDGISECVETVDFFTLEAAE